MGAGCVQNPRSNRNNRVGYPKALRHVARVALGTDGFPSDMVDELDTLRVCATGFDDDVSRAERRLAAGATLVAGVFGESGEMPQPEVADWREWAQRRQRLCRERLVVDGRLVIERGRLMTADAASIHEEARSEAARLWSRMAGLE